MEICDNYKDALEIAIILLEDNKEITDENNFLCNSLALREKLYQLKKEYK
jgi:hypothetical protein